MATEPNSLNQHSVINTVSEEDVQVYVFRNLSPNCVLFRLLSCSRTSQFVASDSSRACCYSPPEFHRTVCFKWTERSLSCKYHWNNLHVYRPYVWLIMFMHGECCVGALPTYVSVVMIDCFWLVRSRQNCTSWNRRQNKTSVGGKLRPKRPADGARWEAMCSVSCSSRWGWRHFFTVILEYVTIVSEVRG